MGVRAYGRETLASLPIDVDKNWNDRSISNVNSLQANGHITITARGANRKLYPALNRYDSETDGWYVSKDNGDIERKFFKDDFSVDSSSQYSGDVGSFTWDTVNKRLTCDVSNTILRSIVPKGSHIYNTDCIVRAVVYVPTTWDYNYIIRIDGSSGSARIQLIGNGTYVYMYYYNSGNYYKRTDTPMSIVRDAYNLLEFVISKSSVTFY